MRFLLPLVLLAGVAPADDKVPAWYARAVKSATASIEPATAKPGQTVTLRITVEIADGHYTYPLKQPDKAAAGMNNKLVFPDPKSGLIVVGDAIDPADPVVKSEPLLGIEALHTYVGKVVYERPAVVAPDAKPGELKVETTLKLNVCDKNNCFPPRAVPLTATVTVAGAAVEVEPKYRAEVLKARQP
jgi:hypothetical protein